MEPKKSARAVAKDTTTGPERGSLLTKIMRWMNGPGPTPAKEPTSGNDMKQQLIVLFTETAEAHHRAFAATDGADPDWPIWYAEHLQPGISALGFEFTKTELITCLTTAEAEREARAPDADWPAYYADHFSERFAPSKAPGADTLALYMTPFCPFCVRVMNTIEELGIEIEFRDIFADRTHREALVAARGRATVPVLRITGDDGERWMPESRDIIRYLKKMYG